MYELTKVTSCSSSSTSRHNFNEGKKRRVQIIIFLYHRNNCSQWMHQCFCITGGKFGDKWAETKRKKLQPGWMRRCMRHDILKSLINDTSHDHSITVTPNGEHVCKTECKFTKGIYDIIIVCYLF
mmetsp:Transcript_3579/g.16379  ORF Transcript_3579/g.16379 Transcript_3579/m.16379 type:complete len:125 (+) Transcript_3579:883-1257(+)